MSSYNRRLLNCALPHERERTDIATVWYAGHWTGREVAVKGGKPYAQMTLGELVLKRIAYVRTEEPCTIKSYAQ